MNVKDLKRQAEFWSRQQPSNKVGSYECAKAMHDAIMKLPDDPQAEHEDLVEMAREYLRRLPHATGAPLAEAVIARLDKREVPDPVLGSPECWGALYRRVAILESKLTRLARLTGTEEV